MPVLGQLLDRITPDFAIKDAYEDAFAPGYDIESGFENPDQVVEDFEAMTYTSFDESSSAEDDYAEEIPLDERLATAAIPLLVIFGDEDQIYDADESVAAFEDVPGMRSALVDGRRPLAPGREARGDSPPDPRVRGRGRRRGRGAAAAAQAAGTEAAAEEEGQREEEPGREAEPGLAPARSSERAAGATSLESAM